MHPNPRRIVPVVLILAAAGGLAWWWFANRGRAEAGGLSASGTIETVEVSLSPELGGRVQAVSALEGDVVQAGQVLVQFDTALLVSQRAQAAAALAAAEANYESLQDGAAAGQLAAAVARAGAEVLDAEQALQNLKDSAALATAQAQMSVARARDELKTARRRLGGVTAPDLQFYRDRMTDAQNALLNAQQNVEITDIGSLQAALQAARDLLKIREDRLGVIQAAIDGCPSCDPDRYVTVDRIPQRLDDARDDYHDALNRVRELELKLDQAGRANATAIRDAQDRLDDSRRDLADAEAAAAGSPDAIRLALAEAEVALAEARLAAAQDDYARVRSGPDPDKLAAAQARLASARASLAAAQAAASPERLAAAQAQVDMARAALEALDVQIAKMTLTAPVSGTVLARAVEPGEVVLPGAPLIVLADLSRLQITVYISEVRYGTIALGETAAVAVDSFPGETFSATVQRIADRAEFTPRNVQTAEGRRATVFAVRLAIDNPGGRLKPGMPADVRFGR